VFAGGGYLASPGASGAALAAGVRLGVGRHLGLSFDLGYGVLGSSTTTQDRWWLMPSVAWVVPIGRVRFDVGAGVGLGASSGYTNLAAYIAQPFEPVWAYQLVPAARAHVMASVGVARGVDVFARLVVASLWLGAGPFGFRAGNEHPSLTDTTWGNLWVGVMWNAL
jgi:hypothetical protein